MNITKTEFCISGNVAPKHHLNHYVYNDYRAGAAKVHFGSKSDILRNLAKRKDREVSIISVFSQKSAFLHFLQVFSQSLPTGFFKNTKSWFLVWKYFFDGKRFRRKYFLCVKIGFSQNFILNHYFVTLHETLQNTRSNWWYFVQITEISFLLKS